MTKQRNVKLSDKTDITAAQSQAENSTTATCKKCDFRVRFCPCCGAPLLGGPSALTVAAAEETAPDKPQSPFEKFCAAVLQRKDPRVTSIGNADERRRKLGELWLELQPSERLRYETVAAEQTPNARKQKRVDTSDRVDEPVAKKPRQKTNFMIFCDMHRADVSARARDAAQQNGGKFSITDVASTLGNMWRTLSPEEKMTYVAPGATKPVPDAANSEPRDDTCAALVVEQPELVDPSSISPIGESHVHENSNISTQ